MRKWIKRLLVVFGLALFTVIVFTLTTLALYKSTPPWYASPIPPAQRAELARQAETKMTATQNWATLLHGDAVRTLRATQSNAPPPSTRVTEFHEIRFTQDELNALFEKWSALYGWGGKYSQYLQDPRIILQPDRLILAATLKELGAVTSFHFAPRLDENGQLRLDLVRVMGGRLPLPEALWTTQRTRIVDSLKWRIPTWQPSARIDEQGAANQSAMSVTLGRLVMRAAASQPGDPILFLPVNEASRSVPVRVTDLQVASGEMMLRVRKLTADERAALMQKIRSTDPPS